MKAPWENINRARQAKGITLKEMAQKVGVSESAVQYWKHGKSISLDTLAQLALVLNTSLDALLSRASEQAPASEVSGPHSSPSPALLRETPPPYGTTPAPEIIPRLAAIERRMSTIEQLLLSILAEQRRNSTETKGP